MTGFIEVYSTKATDITPVHKYKSETTGLTVVVAEVEGPIVSAFICLATEAHDDDGLPHTLEHLIFLGSELYPYKGLLDLLANRCLASGTNAWTDVDHTAYSLQTAGAGGTLALLPVYMDHVLYPVLTDSAFLTEVHHVSGSGTHAGVVYCEMQGRENSAESRCYNKLQQMIYPNSGYSSETGGKLHNLRTSTTNQKVKEYHKKFYRPENITLIIAGQIKPVDVFQALRPVEEKIVSKGVLPPFVRPWQDAVPPAGPSETVRLPYPADQEDCGLLLLGWRGPGLLAPGGLATFTALSVLLRYLCDTPAAPLQKALTEVDQPYASNVVHNMVENAESMFCIMLENVEMSRLQEALPALLAVLARVGDGREPLELERLRRLLRLQRREALAHTETSPHQTITFMCIADMLHSENSQQMEERLNKQRILRELEGRDAEWWRRLCQQWLGGDHKAVVGVPSTSLMEQMAREEEERVQQQRERLGPEGLRQKELELTRAMEHNGREVPAEVLKSVEVADCEGIHYHSLQTWSSEGPPCPHFPLDQMPFYTRIHHIRSHFVYMSLLMDTSVLEPAERDWLPLLLAVLVESPVRREGLLLPHTTLLSDMEELTTDFKLELGIKKGKRFSPGEYGQTAILFTQCEAESYSQVVKLVWEVLKATELCRERVSVVAQRMVQDVATLRRDGERLVVDLLRDINYSPESNVHRCSVLRQQRFLRTVLQRLEADSGAEVLREMEAVRGRLLAGGPWLQLSADLVAHPLSAEPWASFSGSDGPICSPTERGAVVADMTLLRPVDQRWGRGSVMGVGGLESCFLEQVSPGPCGYGHPELPALLVALQYFTQLEGPMWRLVRGAGLAYGFLVVPCPGEGLLRLMLYKATNPTEAYQQTMTIFKTFLESGDWDENLFACAKSSLIFEIVEREKTPSKLIKEALYNYFHRVDEDYIQRVVKAVCGVTGREARQAAERWLPGLARPDSSTLSIVCHPTRVREIAEQFAQTGHTLDTFSSPEESHLNKD